MTDLLRRSISALGLAVLLGASSSAAPRVQAGRPGQSPRDRTALPLRGGGLAPGRVLSEARITTGAGLPDFFEATDVFGREVTEIGDLDGDGTADLAVSATFQLWILFLAPDGTVRSYRIHRMRDVFGDDSSRVSALAGLGDLDGDGRLELAVGQTGDDEAGNGAGAVWILSFEPDGSFEVRRKITGGRSGFPAGLIDAADAFGSSLAVLDDLDGDGVIELAVGAERDEQGCSFCDNAGSLWILFLNPDGTVHRQGRIGRGAIGHSILVDSGDHFGSAVAALGDLDGDGVGEIAVAADQDDDTFFFAGAVYVIYLGAFGTARASQKINDVAGGFVGDGTPWGSVGADSVAAPGDVDGDGVPDLLVGSENLAHTGGYWVLSLRPNGTVKTQVAVHEGAGITGDPIETDVPGDGLAMLGDRDGNGFRDLALGATLGHGSLRILQLGAGAQVLSEQYLAPGKGGVPPNTLDRFDHLGVSLAALGDLDGDGRAEVAVGAPQDDDGEAPGQDRGAVWVLSLADDGAVAGYTKVSVTRGGFTGAVADDDRFGSALALLGDLDGDGTRELAVGAPRDDDAGGRNRGAVWILSLAPDGSVVRHAKISTAGGFAPLLDEEGLGSALAPLGDLDGDGVPDLAAASPGLNQSSGNGRVWILFLNADGSLREAREIDEGTGGFGGVLDTGDNFGSSLGFLGDLDGDGRPELAVGAARDDDGGTNLGALWLLSLAPDGSVLDERKLSATSGGFAGALDGDDMFGAACAALGDLDGDGVVDLAVGSPGDDDLPAGASDINRGAVWILFLRTDGSVRAHAKISASAGGFAGPLTTLDRFGSALCGELDLDGDGVRDLLSGVPNEDGLAPPYHLSELDKGGLWLLSLAGIAALDFEHGDDVARTALVNGRSLTGPGAFARTLELTGFGANLGPATFDSAPSGPNDPSQDRDLLVGRGNLLVLQNSQAPTQSVPGVFDRPNDDQDGGLFVFRFPAAVAPLSLVLVDIDPGAAQHASVRLFDVAGRTRTFAIPAGWTEDLLVHGPPAWRTLELTTLDPQPGYLASATASESLGFRADEVVRIEVTLGSSGAVDELRFDPHPSGE